MLLYKRISCATVDMQRVFADLRNAKDQIEGRMLAFEDSRVADLGRLTPERSSNPVGQFDATYEVGTPPRSPDRDVPPSLSSTPKRPLDSSHGSNFVVTPLSQTTRRYSVPELSFFLSPGSSGHDSTLDVTVSDLSRSKFSRSFSEGDLSPFRTSTKKTFNSEEEAFAFLQGQPLGTTVFSKYPDGSHVPCSNV